MNVDICFKDEVTPVHLACREGNFEVVKYLIFKGANLNKQVFFNIYLLG